MSSTPPPSLPTTTREVPDIATGASALGGMASGALAMAFVGGSVAVSGALAGSPVFTAQALRYASASLLLVAFVRLSGRSLERPRGVEWIWLLGVASTGLVLFNVALVEGSRHAEPAVLGVAVACVPLALAIVAPLMDGVRPSPRVLLAAVTVTCGAALVQGVGRSSVTGLLWAVVVLSCEAGFTLLAVPVLRRHGAWGVSVHTTWLAAALFLGLAVAVEGPTAAVDLSVEDVLAVAYLAVAVTAMAFVLWYSSVRRIGADRAGLLTGLAPVAAGAAGVALGGPSPSLLVWLGIVVVMNGLAVGLRRPTERR